MAVWRGERRKMKGDGSGQIERQRRSFNSPANSPRPEATTRTIARALAERDMSLGWRKYADRTDADRQYLNAAARAVADVDTQREKGFVPDYTRSQPSRPLRHADTPTDDPRPATIARSR